MPATAPTMTDALAEPYAKAWFELAQQQGMLDEAADEAEQLAVLFAESIELRSLFENPAIDANARAGVLDRLFEGRVSDLTRRFLHVVNRKGRADRYAAIFAAFRRRFDEHRGVVAATATVAEALPDDRLSAIADELGRSLGGKTVRLEQHTDASILGGLRLRVGDRLLDASVATQLKKIEQQMKTQGREKARQAAAALD